LNIEWLDIGFKKKRITGSCSTSYSCYYLNRNN